MNLLDLNTTWYILVAVLLTGYTILDGFDLGVGILTLFTKNNAQGELDRRIMLNSIGPVWDGNEVWLLTGGGALFAAFPHVYATVFSGFYTALMLLLCALIFRAVSLEFRGKVNNARWRMIWDRSFGVSSLLIALLLGVALGNMVVGIPLGPDMEFTGNFFTLLNPYSVLMGVVAILTLACHGAHYSVVKTEGALLAQAKTWTRRSFMLMLGAYILLTAVTPLVAPRLFDVYRAKPALFALPVLVYLTLAGLRHHAVKGQDGRAFFASCVAIALMLVQFAIGSFPNLVFSNPSPELSLHIINAASSQKTLEIMRTIALLGMPVVIAYTAVIYWVFRGKVKLDNTSY